MDPIAGGSSSEFLMSEPADQIKDRIEERDNVFSAYPVIADVMTRLSDRIAFYKSLDSIDQSVLADTETFMHTVAANKLTAENLQSEWNELDTLVKEHLQPQLG